MIWYLVNNEFQKMWEEAKNSVVSVELDNMTKDCGMCLKYLLGGQQLHIDYKPEITLVEKEIVGE